MSQKRKRIQAAVLTGMVAIAMPAATAFADSHEAKNPCAAANPCAANPCAANPCAANPCAANPCAANPCAAANPCNPCKPKNPCAGG